MLEDQAVAAVRPSMDEAVRTTIEELGGLTGGLFGIVGCCS
jgi:hypothetical protein